MADTATDVFVETIMAWGIDTIFGIPGDGVNGVIESLRKRQDKVKFIQTRHEESASFMACAYAKYTGKLGCCLTEMLDNEACRHAMNNWGVSAVIMPIGYQEAVPSGKYSQHKKQENTTNIWSKPILVPSGADLQKAADILNAARKPALLAGQVALGASDEVIALAEKLGAPIVKALLGKAAVPDDHPLTTCGLGLLGTGPSEDMMKDCDAILFICTSFPDMEYLPKHEQAKSVQIDDMPNRIGLRYPVEVGLVGDAKATRAASPC